MITIRIDEKYNTFVSPDVIRESALETLRHLSQPQETFLAVVITDDAELLELNQKYLGFSKSTDVLSFPSGEEDPDMGGINLGDVIISYPRAEKQAHIAGHAVEVELQVLTVHGVLHLLGYDHANPGEKREMWEAQATILSEIGCEVHLP